MQRKHDHEADWQPVSDGIMPDEGLYLITWEGTWNTYKPMRDRWIELAEYFIVDGEGQWSLDHIAIRGFKDIKVIAWMDLPEKWGGD